MLKLAPLILLYIAVLNDFIKNKIIILKKDGMDGRKRLINLSNEGKKLHDEIYFQQRKRIYNAFKNSDSDSVIKFKSVLNKIINE